MAAITKRSGLLKIEAGHGGFGAEVTGLDLTRPLSDAVRTEIRSAWADYAVLSFRDQPLTLDQFEAFTLTIGPFGRDPFIQPMPGRPNVLELRREPDEKAVNFGAGWHSDWSFLETPPAATLLRSEVTPPVGGETCFADGRRAYDDLSPAMKARLAPMKAVHSAGRAYGVQGVFARETEKRTLKILVSDEADTQLSHPLVRTHPVTGRKALYISPVYTVGIEGLPEKEGQALLGSLFAHMIQPQYVYKHVWTQGAVLLWDNRCTMHLAKGGYDGHLRVMHRTTVAGEVPV
ncbi:MAG: taurine dioxygenase [Phenylobacterium zucineum]|nr:MAG: taurine dioxygenase [Phenylobacterium zucineum]